jgi:hypothetical protein
MKAGLRSLLVRSFTDERGQIIPWFVLLGALIFGIGGLSVDLGHAYVSYEQLKASTNAAAMAGAYAMIQPGATTTSVTSAMKLYGSASGGANSNPNFINATFATPVFRCVTDYSSMVAAPCAASPTGYNTVQIQQTATVPTFFVRMLRVMGVQSATSLTLSATSSATMASGQNDQVNVAMVVDSTASMNTSDSNCGATRIACAMQGVQTMLGDLAPCTAGTAGTGTCTGYDRVSLFTFPNVQANTVSSDTDCSSSSNSTIVPYTTPAASNANTWTAPTGTTGTYQITGYLTNWSSNNSLHGSLSSSSSIVQATGGSTGSNCNGLQAIGGDGTYLPGAIYAAQASLAAQSYANPGSRNVMIILSDGDQNAASGKMVNSSNQNIGHNGNTYPSLDDQCHQAITAANYASGYGTTVYTIAYGASNSGCSTDTGSYAISPCSELQQMSTGYVSATNAPHFYSDANASQNSGQCTSQYNLNLNGIFANITAQLTKARLIPNNIT